MYDDEYTWRVKQQQQNNIKMLYIWLELNSNCGVVNKTGKKKHTHTTIASPFELSSHSYLQWHRFLLLFCLCSYTTRWIDCVACTMHSSAHPLFKRHNTITKTNCTFKGIVYVLHSTELSHLWFKWQHWTMQIEEVQRCCISYGSS